MRQGDVEMRLAEQAARLEHYEALERELDEAVLTAASTTGGGGADAGGGPSPPE